MPPNSHWKSRSPGWSCPSSMCCRRMRVRAGLPRHRARLALGTALQIPLLVNFPRVGPLLPDLRRRGADHQLAPLVVGVGFRQRHVHPPAWLLLPRAVDRSSTALKDQRRLLGIQQGPLVHGVRGLRDRRRLLALGKRIAPKDAPPDRVLHGDVEDPAVALPGPGRRLLPTKDGRLLTTRRTDNGTWELPGGIPELNEPPRPASPARPWRRQASTSR